jgi:hypothetical protein
LDDTRFTGRVDTAYRTELREQNEANYARFEAKLDQRVAELGAALRAEMAEMLVRDGAPWLPAEIARNAHGGVRP